MFLEYGAMDLVGAPGAPADGAGFPPFVFADANGNGLDDGRETQANMYQALLDTVGAHPGLLNGVFWWGNWMTDDERWASYWARHRSYAIRDKLSEQVIRSTYAARADNRPPLAAEEIPPHSVRSGDRVPVYIASYFRDPDGDRLTYTARSSDPGVATVRMTGALLEITAATAGDATIAVTASDGAGWATQTLRVTSCAPATGCPDPSTGFTDHPIRPGATPVKAAHFLELRARIEALRAREGLPVVRWTDAALTAGSTAERP